MKSSRHPDPPFARSGVFTFISYRRTDTGGHAVAIYGQIEKALGPTRVFIDLEDIANGHKFQQTIISAIEQASVLVVVIGQQFASARLFETDDVVRREIEYAIAGKHTVLPVLVDGASMPSKASLPSSISTLADWQACSLDSYNLDFYRRNMRRLVDDLVLLYNGVPIDSDRCDATALRANQPFENLIDRRTAMLAIIRDDAGSAEPRSIYLDEQRWPHAQLRCGGEIRMSFQPGTHSIWTHAVHTYVSIRMGHMEEDHRSNKLVRVFEPGLHFLRLRSPKSHFFLAAFNLSDYIDVLEYEHFQEWSDESERSTYRYRAYWDWRNGTEGSNLGQLP